MNNNEFIEKVKLYVRDAAIEDLICKLEKPHGRKPRKKSLIQSKWYNKLLNEDKIMLSKVIEEAVDEAIFGFLAVLDGVRIIEEDSVNSRLELKCIDIDKKILLNDPDKEYLHDIYNYLTNKE
jgi:hypothetical protein